MLVGISCGFLCKPKRIWSPAGNLDFHRMHIFVSTPFCQFWNGSLTLAKTGEVLCTRRQNIPNPSRQADAGIVVTFPIRVAFIDGWGGAELYSQRSRNRWKQMEATLENSGGSELESESSAFSSSFRTSGQCNGFTCSALENGNVGGWWWWGSPSARRPRTMAWGMRLTV